VIDKRSLLALRIHLIKKQETKVGKNPVTAPDLN
jgi:hypothetical protein